MGWKFHPSHHKWRGYKAIKDARPVFELIRAGHTAESVAATLGYRVHQVRTLARKAGGVHAIRDSALDGCN